MGADIMTNKNIFALLPLLLVVACKTPEEKVTSAVKDAQQEIGKAKDNVAATKQEAAQKIADAAPQSKDEAKIDATKKVAEAENKVDDEKIDATKEIVDAEQAAGAGGNYTKQ
jgi:hypothetical protein